MLFQQAREAIRSLWGDFESQKPANCCSLIFVVGKKVAHSFAPVEKEALDYGDILGLGAVEHYNNLTLKTVALLKYFVRTKWKVLKTCTQTLTFTIMHFPFLLYIA